VQLEASIQLEAVGNEKRERFNAEKLKQIP
jgi:hypothetical protein